MKIKASELNFSDSIQFLISENLTRSFVLILWRISVFWLSKFSSRQRFMAVSIKTIFTDSEWEL